jgi:hypothetical protein
MEIYEMDYNSNTGIQEVCQLKQPFVFSIPEIASMPYICMDYKVKDTTDYHSNTSSVDYVVLPPTSFNTLLKTDTNGKYFTEMNDVELSNQSHIDRYIKPYFVVHTKGDIYRGSANCRTPLKYHTHYRQFFFVQTGRVSIKMIPWSMRKHLSPVEDYDNYEFWSAYNPWTGKIQTVDCILQEGSFLYVPPYWWYSFQYHDEHSEMVAINYHSTMSVCANLPAYIRYYFQYHTTKKQVVPLLKEDHLTMESVSISPASVPPMSVPPMSVPPLPVPPEKKKEESSVQMID